MPTKLRARYVDDRRANDQRSLAFESLEDRRLLAVFSVSNLDDGPVAAAGDLPGSLRQAIFDANNNGEADIINFSVAGTIDIVSQLPTITSDVLIDGNSQIIIDAGGGSDGTVGNGDGYRLFDINDGDNNSQINVTIERLILTGGDETEVIGNRYGGAIRNNETLLISEVTIIDNAANTGGGIFNQEQGVLTIDSSTLSNNIAPNGDGGALQNYGVARILQSELLENTAPGSSGDGGAISNTSRFNDGPAQLDIRESTLSGNSATVRGGGVFSYEGTISIVDSLIAGNSARFGGGLNLRDSVSSDQITNSTISDNEATTAFGGGISSQGGVLEVQGSTITANRAASVGGGLFSGSTIHMRSSIVAGNEGNDLSGTLATDEFNLIGGDPLLGPLADNGGPTLTHALLPGSPALDAGSVPTPVHVYELNNSLADENGGPSLVANGGTLTATGYDFDADQGLNLSNALIDPANYTITVDFSFDAFFNYQSIINFTNLTEDGGLYSFNNTLSFWDDVLNTRVAFSDDVFTPGQQHELVFTRNSTTEVMTAYVDGLQVWSHTDVNQQAVFSGTDQIIQFFQDNSFEEQAGFVDRIRIYDGAVELPIHDQRGTGFDRVVGTAPDIGAYEAQQLPSGNFINDAVVDGSDFLAWQLGFGMANATLADGNSDDDTDVDASDLAAWHTTYGESLETVGGGGAHNNVQASLGLNYLIATQGLFPSDDIAFQGDVEPTLGEIALFAGNFEPRGWEFADGELLSIAQNQALFSVIGTTYGGNGTTNFALPDLRGRTTLGEGNGPGLTTRSLGEMTGAETVTLTEAQLPAHSHPLSGVISTTDDTGGGAAHENIQPSLGMNYLLTSTGTFPSFNGGGGVFHNGILGAVTAFAGTDFFTNSPNARSLDGQLLPISQNSALFSILGTIHGGDGRTTVGLPDLRGRSPVHDGNGIQLGQRLGAETATLTTANLPRHDHELPGTDASSGTTGNGTGHENRQPSLALNYVINLSGTFPQPSSGFSPSSLGAINIFAGNFAPNGTAFLDGQLLSIAQNTELFSIIGTTYGGDGTNNFALPDLRGRTPVGMGQGAGLTNRDWGKPFGESTVNLTINEIPAHSHDITPTATTSALTADLVNAALAAEWMNVSVTPIGKSLARSIAPNEEVFQEATRPGDSPESSLLELGDAELDIAQSETGDERTPPELTEELLAGVFE